MNLQSKAGVTCAVVLAIVMAIARAGTALATEPIVISGVTGTARLGGVIAVAIPNVAASSDGKHDICKAVLYLADQQLKGVYPRNCRAKDELQFDLKRTDQLKEAWAVILGAPDGFTRKVTVAVGFEDGAMLASGGSVELTLIRTDWVFGVFLSLFILAAGLFAWLVVSSNILRDPGPEPASGARKTFSLARWQMAWWFFIILSAYLLIWIMTGDRDTLSSSALALFGISSATALGAVAIDASKRANAAASLPPMSSQGFIDDILTDKDGISLHRFQIMIWTIVLGFIFAISVYNNLGMPEFSGTLLALMGISNGTYIGFKFPEQQT